MKKTYLTLSILIFVFSFSYAQTKKKDKWGLSVAMNSIQAQVEVPLITSIGGLSNGIGAVAVDADGNIIARGDRVDNSFSLSIVPKYYINDDILLRFELGITNLKLKGNSDSKGTFDHIISNEEVTTQILRYTPGFQWIFMKEKKIESYCGLTVSYVNYENVNISVYQEIRQPPTDTVYSWVKLKELTPGGFSIGIGAFTGFNIYLNKHISLGAELSSSGMYYKLGGEATLDGEEGPFHPEPAFHNIFNNSFKGFKISKIISSYNISLWF